MLWSAYLVAALAYSTGVYAAYKPLTTGFPTSIDPLTATIKDLSAALASGQVTSEQLVSEYLARMDRNNHKGLNLRAVIEPAPRDNVLAIAREADKKRKDGNGQKFGPLFGIPILVKDNYATDVSLGMNSTAGSFALLPENAGPVQQDATTIAKLRAAGAIIIGKANLSELSNFKGTNMKSGWSARGGQTQNPFKLGGPAVDGGDPCGSSAGTGSGVAAGFAPAGLGTETDGSIICPSNRHALYAIKPSVGVASRAGIVPISHTQDSPGPMAKSVYDVAVLLNSMVATEADPRDSATSEAVSAHGVESDYTQYLVNSFNGLTIGVPNKSFFWAPQDPKDTTSDTAKELQAGLAAIAKMKTLGATVVEDADLPNFNEIISNRTEGTVLNFDFKQDFKAYTSELGNPAGNTKPVRTLEDLIKFNNDHADIEMPKGNCCQENVEAAQNTTDLNDPVYKSAVATGIKLTATEGLDVVFATKKVDALIVPAEYSSFLPAVVGYPVATVPLGVHGNGQPYGLGIIGKRYDEKSLLKIMSAYEANFPARKVPDSVKNDQQK